MNKRYLFGIMLILVIAVSIIMAFYSSRGPYDTPYRRIISYCDDPNVAGVYACSTNYFLVVSKLLGGGFTVVDSQGVSIANCPIVSPDFITDDCKYYSSICSTEINIC
jgi:hypothetical protein